MRDKRRGAVLLLMAGCAVFAATMSQPACAQAAGSPAPQMESVQALVAHLTPEQKQQFDEATKEFNAQHFVEALAIYKEMLKQLPADTVLTKFAGEAALNSGDANFALNVLRPLAAADANDWQAAALLTQACAESGDATCRDAGMAHMLDLHRRGIAPAGMQQYVVERVKAGENTLLIWTSVEPWGPYKVYALGQVMDKEGKIFQRITLESSDVDQVFFAQQHPQEAAKGMRRFSIDGYRESGLNSNGQRTQSHETYKMLDGQPSYEVVREEFLKIVNGKQSAMSSRTNLVVQ